MVDGAWGSGKTHLVKSLMDELAERDVRAPLRKPLYVSLYGVRNAGEIGDQLYQQLHPLLGHRYTRFAASVLRGTLKGALKIDLGGEHHGDAALTTQIPDLKLSELLEGAAQRIIIFDDFERAVMTPTEILGFINPLVEHDDCKVVIVTNEAEVSREEAYLRRKEKTVGRTLRLQADGASAFAAFLARLDDQGARAYLQEIRQDVLDVFGQSELHNLRLLQQFVWSFEQLWTNLRTEQRINRDAMRDIATLLCAATLELRSGRTPPDAFKSPDIRHYMQLRAGSSDPSVLVADAVFKRYPTVKFERGVLDAETVAGIVLDAAFPLQAVQEQLAGHPLFQHPAEIASWRALWHSASLSSEELDEVLERFRDDSDSRRFRDVREVLHVAGLCLWLSDLGQPGWDTDRVAGELAAYVEGVYAADQEDDLGEQLSRLDRSLPHGAFGLGFVNQEDPRLGEVARRIIEAVKAARRRSYPAAAAELSAMMTSDSEAFLREVCFTESGSARYARSAVLRCIPAREFAATLAGAARQDQDNVAMALSIRYDQAPGEPELRDELPWLAEVLEAARVLASQMKPIPRCHFKRLLEGNVQKHVARSDLREAPPDTDDGT